jgi:D-xylose transport system ATP-binding protein
MAGLYRSEFEGQIELGGSQFTPGDVSSAEAAGIVLIAQEINVVPEFTVAQMLLLNREPTRFGLLDRELLEYEATQILAEFGVDVALNAKMGSLDLAHQQLVMIARALSTNAGVLILDEPTAALTSYESERLFERLRSYRDRGTSCIFVSHRLAEVFALADRIVVMRDGRLVGDHATTDTHRDEIVAEMLGDEREVSSRAADRASAPTGSNRLRVRGLSVYDQGPGGRTIARDVDLEVRAGEIVGLFGLVGSGAGPVAASIFGAWHGRTTGVVEIDGRRVDIDDPETAVANGVGFIAQDRRDALIADQTVAANIVLASLPRFSPHLAFDHASARSESNKRVNQLDIRTRSDQTLVHQLSGGNQQKVQVARWLTADTPILILDDPNRGVDVGARAEILQILRNLAAEGRSLLLVSSEARELLEVCDRILVMVEGRIVREFNAKDASETDLVRAAAAIDSGEPAA